MTNPRPDPDFTNFNFPPDSDSADKLDQADHAVGRVIAWHSKQLMREERAGGPDQERMAQLEEGLAQAQAARRSIPLADDEERQRLIDEYSALRRRLTAE